MTKENWISLLAMKMDKEIWEMWQEAGYEIGFWEFLVRTGQAKELIDDEN